MSLKISFFFETNEWFFEQTKSIWKNEKEAEQIKPEEQNEVNIDAR